MDKRVFGLGSVFALVLVAMLGYAQLARTGGPPVCGNAAIEDGEECDDSNTVAGDGCNATCLIEGPMTKTQQGCINGVNASFAFSVAAANTASTQCVKGIANGTTGGTFAQCVGGADFTPASTKAANKNNNLCVAKGVLPATTFAYVGDPTALTFGAIFQTGSAHGDLLGNPTAIAPASSTAAALCQKTVVKGYAKYVNALAKHTNKAKRASLKDKFSPPLTSLELSADLLPAASSPKVATALSSLKTKASAKCTGQNLDALFPGACEGSATPNALGDCAGQLGRCRYCLALNDADHLQLDCEAYSGLALCPPPGAVAACGDGNLDPDEDCDDSNTVGGDGCRADCTQELCGDDILDPDEDCDDANTVDDDGCDALCQIETCGNGIVQTGSGEECDDGDTVSGDGCSATCQMESCGNGTVEKGEDCDDENTVVGDGCAACLFEECGNGVLQSGEECDDGNTVSGDNCSAACDDEFCGDAVFQVALGEECDDGNTDDHDGCDIECLTVPVCGNGSTQPGEECDDGNRTPGDGCSASCTSEACGDGVLNPQEDCDDNNTVNGDGCDATCDLEVCGNGEIQVGEQCDDGNSVSGDGCTATCALEDCGDGVTQLGIGEECDDGNTISGDGCTAFCQDEFCGDSVIQGGLGEECDDGNTVNGDNCDATCDLEVCGNGEQQSGEECDDGNTVPGDNCDAACNLEECGNGAVQVGEDCDDGNTANGDGCDSTCDVEECGNSEIQSGEECDDGNTASGDGCTSLCQNEACGDGILQGGLGEECDDGNTVNGDNCDSTCDIEICGNGELQSGEECDDGNTNAVDGCDNQCLVTFTCGNGQMQPGEECDDSNTVAGDGCNASCQDEFCGDLITQAGIGETCDDGNLVSGDGCDADCDSEVCGNGEVQTLEQCDDGNLVNDDGCDALCRNEICGNGILQVPSGEECDDGNIVSNDGCTATCQTESCGDSVTQSGIGEECDDGNTVLNDGCELCLIENICGNGNLQAGEECDDGNILPGDGCDAGCLFEAVCGDGTVQPGEECDDNNTVGGDGCSAICQNELAVCPTGTAPVFLGEAAKFAILTQTGITTTGTTAIVGDIGVSPITSAAMTGFSETLDGSGQFATSALVSGRLFAANYSPPTPTFLTTAVGDMGTAYTNAAGRTPDFIDLDAGILGGTVLSPGVYKWNTGVTIPTDLTLSGGADDVWIFQIADTLIVSSSVEVLLVGGAQANNVFWQVTGQTNLGSSSKFKGNILDATAIVFDSTATLDGRALAQTNVTLISNTVTKTDSTGFCWMLGAAAESCTAACLGRGRAYDDATRTFSGSAGTLAQCADVADALTLNLGASDGPSCTAGVGCEIDAGDNVLRCLSPTTDASSSAAGIERFCACTQP